MAFKEYAEKKQRHKKRRLAPILGAAVLVVVIVGALAFYNQHVVTSNTVYCGVFQYLEFRAQTVIHGTQSNVTETMTTAVSYTTSTSIIGRVGHTYSNATTTTNAHGDAAGVETICKYISDVNFSSSSSS
jgi:predicted ribosomally synthesized peptide with SipW-like signal peptide